jgi:aryl-alcohol dehydrogenase-like predicted oxidoreductase
MSDGDSGLSAAQINKQIDDSLRRLKTDYVDLYQCHRFDPNVPIQETMHALNGLVKAGKVRYLGFSEWTSEQIRSALNVPDVQKFVSSQPQYNLLWRTPESEIFKLSEENGISQIVWSPLAQGVLTGKYKPGEEPPADSRAASEGMSASIVGRYMKPEILEAVQKLKPIAEGLNITMSQLALAWVLRRKEVASAIIGASKPEQIEENIAAVNVALSDDVLNAVDEAVGSVVAR